MERSLTTDDSHHDGSIDETVQVNAPIRQPVDDVCPIDGECRPGLAFVEGSGPGIDSQTDLVVQRRMQIASLMLFTGFAAFLARALNLAPIPTGCSISPGDDIQALVDANPEGTSGSR